MSDGATPTKGEESRSVVAASLASADVPIAKDGEVHSADLGRLGMLSIPPIDVPHLGITEARSFFQNGAEDRLCSAAPELMIPSGSEVTACRSRRRSFERDGTTQKFA